MHRYLLTFLFMVFAAYLLQAQHSSMLLINGDVKGISKYKIQDDEGLVYFTTLKGKDKQLFKEDVFSITTANQEELVLYTPDESFGETLTIPEMRLYLNGVQSGSSYKAHWAFVGGLATGFAGAVMPQPKLTVGDFSMKVPVGYFIPFGYVIIVGNTTKSSAKLKQDFPKYANSDYFIEGVAESVRRKRSRSSLWGAGVGVLAGIITNSVVK